MTEGHGQDLRLAGDRIERLLGEVGRSGGSDALGRAEELVRVVSDLYGAALERVVALAAPAGEAGSDTDAGAGFGSGAGATLEALAADDLVASLLVVHGLHPSSVEERVSRALAGVRPFLAQHGGDVSLVDVDVAAGAVHLRLLGSCDGCPSSAITLRSAVETAIVEAAPEIVRIDVDEPSGSAPSSDNVIVPAAAAAPGSAAGGPAPVALTRKPAYDSRPAEVTAV